MELVAIIGLSDAIPSLLSLIELRDSETSRGRNSQTRLPLNRTAGHVGEVVLIRRDAQVSGEVGEYREDTNSQPTEHDVAQSIRCARV